MTSAGDGANVYGIFITNLFGTGTITNSSVTNSQTNNLKISNNAATPGTLTVGNSTFTTTDPVNGGDAVNIETGVGGTQVGNLTLNLTGNNNLNSSQGDGLQAAANDNSTLRVSVNGTGSNYNGNHERSSVFTRTRYDLCAVRDVCYRRRKNCRTGEPSNQALSR